MEKTLIPQDQVFWYLENPNPNQLKNSIKVDIVIIGGGMAGITAAQFCKAKGLNVALLERYYCGAGASGKSSGFITPNSELGLTHFVDEFGVEKAAQVWSFVNSGVDVIKKNIIQYSIKCDYIDEDTLVVANSKSGLRELKQENDNYQKLGYQSKFYEQEELSTILGSHAFYGGMRSYKTFGIRAYAYLQKMKDILTEQGVQIYEDTPAISIEEHKVTTPLASVQADYIIIAVDKFLPELNRLNKTVFHAQTFIMMSAPLSDSIISKIFPKDKFMMWDTDLVYQYFRLTADNRFLIGGATWVHTFQYKTFYHSNFVYKKLSHYVQQKFPEAKINFEYFWPGMLGVSPDLTPIAGRDKDQPSIYYISAATGLPWAAALGNYATEHLFDNRHDLDDFFSPYRSFPLGNILQKTLPKPISFGLSNLISVKI